ncbi:unnamed protein product [Notodromas monacha]|uniref:Uncharacterized protein n=1 Tax=Notodromas monacha TaxID=399045 RepID=A0A7R9BRG6_9CRUS|nr:unnamed protein product [Notodromas monacha]CAG0918965.1 unnamed protein product [Notodromas monacha]
MDRTGLIGEESVHTIPSFADLMNLEGKPNKTPSSEVTEKILQDKRLLGNVGLRFMKREYSISKRFDSFDFIPSRSETFDEEIRLVDVHATLDPLLFCGADDYENLYFYKVELESSGTDNVRNVDIVRAHNPTERRKTEITFLKFVVDNPELVLTASANGFVRGFNLTVGIYEKVCSRFILAP